MKTKFKIEMTLLAIYLLIWIMFIIFSFIGDFYWIAIMALWGQLILLKK